MITIKGYKRCENAYNEVISVVKTSDEEAVTLDEVKLHCKIDFNDDDAYLKILIPACQQAIENYTGQSLVPSEVTAVIHNDITGMPLPFGPYTDDFSATYGDDDTVLGDELYRVKGGVLYQSAQSDLTLIYTAGYDEDTLPAALKLAVLMEINYRYNRRGDEDKESGICASARALAAPYKTQSWLI